MGELISHLLLDLEIDMFVDRAEIIITSGKGGDGAVTFRREPYVPEGGPDGGDGGDGGNIIFVADSNLRTLMDFKYKRKYEAENGQNGMRRKKYGKRGRDLEIKVPIGTMIIDKESGLLMKDMADKGDRLVAAKGGKGGKGNVHFKNSIRQAPNFAEAGELPKERTVILELKLIADVGLVGFPNVGKSTLLSVSTSARPKVANYHFTTIDPNLGVVDMYDKSFVMADIAGIIEGAHEGMGLGLKFLKHIERTKVLIHVVDISGSEGRDPIDDYKKIIEELGQYDEKLLSKPMLVAANKIDAACDEERLENFVKFVEADGKRVFKISAVARQGVQELLNAALNELENYIEPESDEIEYFDFVRDEIDEDFKKLKAYRDLDGVYVLEGKQLSKIFRSTNFNDIGSMRYLYKFIVDRGGIKMLEKLGLKEGDTVRIEDYEFEYYED